MLREIINLTAREFKCVYCENHDFIEARGTALTAPSPALRGHKDIGPARAFNAGE